ncbi:hypothetical protein J437_LFUL017202 [Ladona fulva]|uniref:BHLH domain-containing protein n=1 Tax=Ladona fulva TaxID=123851 RepID=A0A8K0P8Y4_LADFU|nr:hypothetical protein J437_LFUL017202 [Ladona fulva]
MLEPCNFRESGRSAVWSADARAMDPFSPENRIPLPSEISGRTSTWRGCWTRGNDSATAEQPAVRKRNERERARVRNVNEGFERLKRFLPEKQRTKRNVPMSKVEVLKETIVYIRRLEIELGRINSNGYPSIEHRIDSCS